MYQFYYAEPTGKPRPDYQKKLKDVFTVTAIRPTMWEEHCLECSAPQCFESCVHFEARCDGRCKRFVNGIEVRPEPNGCCGQAAHITFRKWANMMTILFSAMLPPEECRELTEKNQRLGESLRKTVTSALPIGAKWGVIRGREYIRRRGLRALRGMENSPDAFVFHGYSFEEDPFRLIVEIYDDHTSRFKTSLLLESGENLLVLGREQLTEACWTNGYLVKVYPENDREAELDILWCDFVQGTPVDAERPAATVKCVVWDLDNTLWDGILIETEDPDTLTLLPGVEDVIRQLDERGIIQSIASKNDYAAAWSVVERLGLAEYFLYPQIHWNAKSGSMRQIAESLNIGLDTLALIDDSSFEREQVRTMCPQVRVYDAAELDGLLERPELTVVVTEESRNRRAMYRAEEKRNQLKAGDNTDTVEFLKKCHLRIKLFTPEKESELLRCFELVVRTNQLNMSGSKYTEEEFADVLDRPGHRNVAFSCEDDFGGYGIVGFGQYKVENGALVFTEFAMSCRVAGKYVESAFFAALLAAESCENGRFSVQKTKKNILLRRTLEDIGFHTESGSEKRIDYTFNGALKERELVAVNYRQNPRPPRSIGEN